MSDTQTPAEALVEHARLAAHENDVIGLTALIARAKYEGANEILQAITALEVPRDQIRGLNLVRRRTAAKVLSMSITAERWEAIATRAGLDVSRLLDEEFRDGGPRI